LLEWKKKKTVKRTFLAQDCRSVERASAKIYASPRNGAKFPAAGPAPVLSELFSPGTDLRHSTNAAYKPGKWLAKAQHSVSVPTPKAFGVNPESVRGQPCAVPPQSTTFQASKRRVLVHQRSLKLARQRVLGNWAD